MIANELSDTRVELLAGSVIVDSKSRGKLFFRLAQQAVAVDPVTYDQMVHPTSAKTKAKPQAVAAT
jgi:hypothetical protein